jgi:heme A synthase
MQSKQKLNNFARYAWFVLGWNLLVILWGVFLRASKSGDGCGQHWLTCQGEVIPSAPQLKTAIEFSHRVSSAIAFLSVLALVIWAYRRFKKGDPIRTTALMSFIFIVTEAAVGAGLVLTGNTAETLTAARPFWMAGHLINTFILLAFLTVTARYASGGSAPNYELNKRYLPAIAIGLAAIIIVGVTGSIAALSTMVFPDGTVAEGITRDLSSTSNILLRLRLLHPITGTVTSIFLVFLVGWLTKESGRVRGTTRWSTVISILVLVQIGFGSATLLTHAPIAMQLGHLFLADAIWISYVIFSANFLSAELSPAIPAMDADSI